MTAESRSRNYMYGLVLPDALEFIMSARLIVIISASGGWRVAAAIQFTCDGVGDVAKFLLLLFEILGRGRGGVLLHPFSGFFDGFEKLGVLLVNDFMSIGEGEKSLQFPCHLRQSCHRVPLHRWPGSSG